MRNVKQNFMNLMKYIMDKNKKNELIIYIINESYK